MSNANLFKYRNPSCLGCLGKVPTDVSVVQLSEYLDNNQLPVYLEGDRETIIANVDAYWHVDGLVFFARHDVDKVKLGFGDSYFFNLIVDKDSMGKIHNVSVEVIEKQPTYFRVYRSKKREENNQPILNINSILLPLASEGLLIRDPLLQSPIFIDMFYAIPVGEKGYEIYGRLGLSNLDETQKERLNTISDGVNRIALNMILSASVVRTESFYDFGKELDFVTRILGGEIIPDVDS